MDNNKIKILSNDGTTVKFPAATKPVLFGATLKQARKRQKISQEVLADMMGVTRFSIINWESNKTQPDYDLIPRLCDILGLSTQELFGVKNELTNFERSLIHNLRLMKPATQRLVSNMVSSLLDKELRAHDEMLLNTTQIVVEEPNEVSAGTAASGILFSGREERPYFLRINDRTENADAVVRVKGHSMEPDYDQGDMVFFEYTNIANVGDDVVIAWGDSAFIKRLAEDGTLYSVNPDYPFEYEGDGNDIHILGRVLGIVGEDDRPSRNDYAALQELFQDEIAAFYRERGIEP